MTADLVSLAIIALVAVLCPLISKSLPHRPIPETVFLLGFGAVLGPHMLDCIQLSDSINLLSELGLTFLFLLAGFEINPKSLTGRQGKRGLVTWLISLALGFLAVRLSSQFSVSHLDGIAVAIALGTTALGTLIPILKEREVMDTRVGSAVLSYGTWGELGPVIAMALLLSTRAEWVTVVVLLVFAAVAALVGIVPRKARAAGRYVFVFFTEYANSTSQTLVRLTVLLLIGLAALSAFFNLDIVLGAFAAGFVLRYVAPEGNATLEMKLDGIAYGFLIPVFFVVSGANIDLFAVAEQSRLLGGFVAMLLLIRAVPIFIALTTDRETRDMAPGGRIAVSLYCTTALPLIVAVTSVAVKAGAMSADIASVLVAAGALTVFVMPVLAGILTHFFPEDAAPSLPEDAAPSA